MAKVCRNEPQPDEQASLTAIESITPSVMARVLHIPAADVDDGGDAGADHFGATIGGPLIPPRPRPSAGRW